jgi:hypothetical protein
MWRNEAGSALPQQSSLGPAKEYLNESQVAAGIALAIWGYRGLFCVCSSAIDESELVLS